MIDPMPLMRVFDKQLTIRMGQANVRRWIDQLLPFVIDDDALELGLAAQVTGSSRRNPGARHWRTRSLQPQSCSL
jgi:hypothetical protein